VIDLNEHGTVEARVQRVQELSDGLGADVVLEVTGVPAAFGEALQLVRPAGRVAEIGNVNVGVDHETPVAPGLITRKGITIRGFVRYQPWFLHRALRFLERRHGDHPFEQLTDRVYALPDAAEAIRQTEEKKVARPAIVP
jgi:threonine dehydrogenase-like Zn-dependent dehydrogenase